MPIDKSDWPLGEWHTEPDEVKWEHAGFRCQIWRHPRAGHLCGYVAIPDDHPWRNLEAHDIDERLADYVFDEDGVRWVGFDCGHSHDYRPGDSDPGDGMYRTVADVTRMVEQLADAALLASK